MSSTFQFSFKNSKAQAAGTGKVFAKKRATNNANTKINLSNNNNNNENKVTKPIKNVIKSSVNITDNKKAITKSSTPTKSVSPKVVFPDGGLVKRKKKKDKQLLQNNQSGNNKSTKQQTHSLFTEKHKKHTLNPNIKGTSVVEKVFSATKTVSDLDIHKYLKSNLEKHHFTSLTNVQDKAIPVVLSGKNVLVRSQTGSGKTLAYAVPILESLLKVDPKLQRSDGCQAIVVVPTRELALQTHELFVKLNSFQWIVVSHLCGGENRKTEKDRLRKGVHVLIGTPGRLLDHILHTAAFKLTNVKCLVLDEADRLLDMGFKKDIVRLVEELDKSTSESSYDPMALLKSRSSSILVDEKSPTPPRQTLLLSATLSKGVAELADFTMKDHIYIDALDESDTINPDFMIIPDTVKQEFMITFVKHRLFTLCALLVAKSMQKSSKIFVFMGTGPMVDYHYDLFTKYLVKMPKNRGKSKIGDVVIMDEDFEFSDEDNEEEVVLDIDLFKLHGSMDQSERKDVFNRFRAAKKGVLLCTDVAARGIDVPSADYIIQYTGPQSDEDYLHRVGRTGRAGKTGSALIFLTHEEQEYVTKLQKHKVFLKEHHADDFLKHLCILMEEPDKEKAATLLQKRFEAALQKDTELHRAACFAYNSWSRFYNTYPTKMREIFNFKKVNLGHYVTSFGLQETPTTIARVVRGHVTKTEQPRLNSKLANHSDIQKKEKFGRPKRKIRSVSLTTSEFSSGLEPVKKKMKKK